MISIVLGHCEVVLPYISDTGVHIPESCIFSQLLNIAAFLIAFTIAIRYKQVEQQCRDNILPAADRIFSLNRWALFLGLLSAFGLSIVANFQELQLFTIHMIGANLAFGLGLIYCATQTRLSYHMYPIMSSGLKVARCRLVLTIILGITFITSSVLGPISIAHFHGTDTTNWKPEDGGYLYHVISSICEWISAMSIDFFILSFAHEFKYMSISSPKFYMISTVTNLQEEQESEDSYSGNGVNVITSESFAANSPTRRQQQYPPNFTQRPR